MEEVTERIQRLQNLMFQMECSDDALFANANGNLQTYKQWEQELQLLRGCV